MGLGQLQQWLPPGAAPPPPGYHYQVTEWSASGAVYDPTTGSTHSGGMPISWVLEPDDPRKTYVPPSPEGGPTAIGTTVGSVPWWAWLAGAAAALYFLGQKR